MASGQQGTLPASQPKPPRAGRRPVNRRNNGGRRRGRRPQRLPPLRRRRTGTKRVTNVAKNVVQKEVKRLGLTGPTPTIVQRATATLGSVQPNQSGNLELEFQMCLNPSLVKEATGSNQFGPIQISASTYSLWKLRSAIFHFQPLVGSSAVSGTVYRISLNLSGSPGSNSWSALGARFHMDVTPGQSRKFHVPKRMLQGTKEGWFQTDPKSDPTNSLGGSIEVHSLGRTMSTYQAQQFTGDLFLLEMTATWEFTNYNAQPGLLTMVKDTHQSKVEVTSDGNGAPLTLEVPIDSKLAQYTGGSTHAPTANGTLGETIWSVVDTGVGVLSGTVPPPFGWLIKGGWWFVRRILGKKTNANGEQVAQFYVYQTLADAQNDNRCITTGPSTASSQSGEYEIQQITPGNVGLADSPSAYAAIEQTTFDPTRSFFFRAYYNQVVRPDLLPSADFQANVYGPFNFTRILKLNTSSEPDPIFPTVTILEDPNWTQSGTSHQISASMFRNQIPIMQKNPDNSLTPLFNAVAYSSYNVVGAGATARFVHLLCWVPNNTNIVQTANSGTKGQNLALSAQWVAANPPQLRTHFAINLETDLSYTETNLLPANSWVLLTTIGTATLGTRYGIPFGMSNHSAVFTAAQLTQIPPSTPFNPSVHGVEMTPIPSSDIRIAHYYPELYDHEEEEEDLPCLEDLGLGDEDEDGSTDDEPYDEVDDNHVPSDDILYDLNEDARLLCLDLQERGIPRSKAAMVAQECFPSDSYKEFQATYEQLLIDGCSPPFSRMHAIRSAQPLVSRGHAE